MPSMRGDPGVLQRLPRGLQQQPLLRVHRQRLTRADPEEPRVEVGRVVREPARSHVGGSRVVRIRVIQAFQVPAAVRREAPDRVRARRDQFP